MENTTKLKGSRTLLNNRRRDFSKTVQKAFVFENVQDEQEIITGLMEWIENCNPETLQKFVRALTGSNTITATSTLKISFQRTENLMPIWMTCFNQMHLFRKYDDQNMFNMIINKCLSLQESQQFDLS